MQCNNMVLPGLPLTSLGSICSTNASGRTQIALQIAFAGALKGVNDKAAIALAGAQLYGLEPGSVDQIISYVEISESPEVLRSRIDALCQYVHDNFPDETHPSPESVKLRFESVVQVLNLHGYNLADIDKGLGELKKGLVEKSRLVIIDSLKSFAPSLRDIREAVFNLSAVSKMKDKDRYFSFLVVDDLFQRFPEIESLFDHRMVLTGRDRHYSITLDKCCGVFPRVQGMGNVKFERNDLGIFVNVA